MDGMPTAIVYWLWGLMLKRKLQLLIRLRWPEWTEPGEMRAAFDLPCVLAATSTRRTPYTVATPP
jgi:hypothetical protein